MVPNRNVAESNGITTADFDWVRERAECSPGPIFERLRMQVKRDVETRRKIAGDASPYKFSFVSEGKSFAAVVDGSSVYRAVRFTLNDDGITVYNGAIEREMFRATLTLADDGECRLKVGEKEYDPWQFRKLALEDAFFDGL
jgi:hypothetical protein